MRGAGNDGKEILRTLATMHFLKAGLPLRTLAPSTRPDPWMARSIVTVPSLPPPRSSLPTQPKSELSLRFITPATSELRSCRSPPPLLAKSVCLLVFLDQLILLLDDCLLDGKLLGNC